MENQKKEPRFRSIFESGLILMAIGGTFVYLGYSFIIGRVDINSTFVFSIALSGLLLVFSDFTYTFSIKSNSKKRKDFSNVYYYLSILLKVFSIFTLIGLPYIVSPSEKMDVLATGFSVITIGLTIVLLSFNYISKSIEDISVLLEVGNKQMALTNKAISVAEELNKQNERNINKIAQLELTIEKQSEKENVNITDKDKV